MSTYTVVLVAGDPPPPLEVILAFLWRADLRQETKERAIHDYFHKMYLLNYITFCALGF
jgi:hypothetical protein